MRIAIVEDDNSQLDAVAHHLDAIGHTCFAYTSAKAFIAALRRESFDLVLLDWNLPEMSGLEALQWTRQNLANPPPAIFLTSRAEEGDIVQGLNAGADDYIVKPYPRSVLQARVEALLRRTYPDQSGNGTEAFGSYRFDTRSETVTVDETPIPLTAKEFGLALLLFRNMHRALSRAHILAVVWGHDPDLVTRTLDMHVSRIRMKLNLRPEQGYRLSPIYSYGYRLERVDHG